MYLYIQERINEICSSRMCACVCLALHYFIYMSSFGFRPNTPVNILLSIVHVNLIQFIKNYEC
jgi:hypothetical protein